MRAAKFQYKTKAVSVPSEPTRTRLQNRMRYLSAMRALYDLKKRQTAELLCRSKTTLSHCQSLWKAMATLCSPHV